MWKTFSRPSRGRGSRSRKSDGKVESDQTVCNVCSIKSRCMYRRFCRQGVIVFVHGFAQYPAAYMEYLYAICDKLNMVILAPTTGIISPKVWVELAQDILVRVGERGREQFIHCLNSPESYDSIYVRVILYDLVSRLTAWLAVCHSCHRDHHNFDFSLPTEPAKRKRAQGNPQVLSTKNPGRRHQSAY